MKRKNFFVLMLSVILWFTISACWLIDIKREYDKDLISRGETIMFIMSTYTPGPPKEPLVTKTSVWEPWIPNVVPSP